LRRVRNSTRQLTSIPDKRAHSGYERALSVQGKSILMQAMLITVRSDAREHDRRYRTGRLMNARLLRRSARTSAGAG
jgi:hypothetical protein